MVRREPGGIHHKNFEVKVDEDPQHNGKMYIIDLSNIKGNAGRKDLKP